MGSTWCLLLPQAGLHPLIADLAQQSDADYSTCTSMHCRSALVSVRLIPVSIVQGLVPLPLQGLWKKVVISTV